MSSFFTHDIEMSNANEASIPQKRTYVFYGRTIEWGLCCDAHHSLFIRLCKSFSLLTSCLMALWIHFWSFFRVFLYIAFSLALSPRRSFVFFLSRLRSFCFFLVNHRRDWNLFRIIKQAIYRTYYVCICVNVMSTSINKNRGQKSMEDLWISTIRFRI